MGNGIDNLARCAYLRKTFLVEAVEITPDNMEEVARHIGEVKVDREHGRHIEVDERIVPLFKRAYTGYYVTFFGEQIRIYTRRSFLSHFVAFDADDFTEDSSIDLWTILENPSQNNKKG